MFVWLRDRYLAFEDRVGIEKRIRTLELLFAITAVLLSVLFFYITFQIETKRDQREEVRIVDREFIGYETLIRSNLTEIDGNNETRDRRIKDLIVAICNVAMSGVESSSRDGRIGSVIFERTEVQTERIETLQTRFRIFIQTVIVSVQREDEPFAASLQACIDDAILEDTIDQSIQNGGDIIALKSEKENFEAREKLDSAISQAASSTDNQSDGEQDPIVATAVTYSKPEADVGDTNIDIFWCEGNSAGALQTEGARIAKALEKNKGSLGVGRIRLRPLNQIKQLDPGYPSKGKQIRFERNEREFAKKINRELKLEFEELQISYNTPSYVSMFVCSK